MILVLFLILQVLFLFFVIFLCLAFVTGAPFVPSTHPTMKRMMELAHLKKGMTIYDLGSGDGKLLFAAASCGVNAIGYEINPFLVLYTTLRIWITRSTRVRVFWQDFWKAPLPDADVVFVYLLPWRMKELEALLTKRLKPGTLVVSNSFIFPNWKVIEKDEKTHVFSFAIPRP